MFTKIRTIGHRFPIMSPQINLISHINSANTQYNLKMNFRRFCFLCNKNQFIYKVSEVHNRTAFNSTLNVMARRGFPKESKIAERLHVWNRPKVATSVCEKIQHLNLKKLNDEVPKIENIVQKRETFSAIIDLNPKVLQSPMKSLQTVYSIIASAFDNQNLLITPIWSAVKHNKTINWKCFCNIKWPESFEITAQGCTKQSAADKVALNFLTYLRSINNINSEGFPIFVSHLKTINNNNIQMQQQRNYRSIRTSSQDTEEQVKGSEYLFLDKEVDNLSQLFPAPKNTVHNYYSNVSRDLVDESFKVVPIYNPVKEKNKISSWCCTYQIKWPETQKFVKFGKTKQEASHKAALSVLAWLKLKEKITKDGHPIIYSKATMKEMPKQAPHELKIDSYTIERMRDIINIYKNDFSSYVIRKLDDIENNNNINLEEDDEEIDNAELKDVRFKSNLKPKFLGINRYLSKEKINLPIKQYKQEFIELLRQNRVVIVTGEPGCGKSTRIPQYVLESWAKDSVPEKTNCRIAVTQPRRIAAISLAERVSSERDELVGSIVGYQVRLKSKFKPTSGRVLYCTTGILLRHLQSDPNFSNFSHIILDEAHERDINTDLLMNLLKTVLETNKELKVVVMSATIDSNLIRNYFSEAPLMHVPGFTYPVKEHFLDDLHLLPLSKTKKMCDTETPSVVHDDVIQLIKYIHKNKPEGAILCFLPGWEDISKIQKLMPSSNDMVVLCLHSRLQDSDQWKIFSKPPPGVRKVILATNIAETSVTIDDVVYVIDSGIHKEQRFDNEKGVQCIDNHWIAKSNMIQRKGRAGRVQPGESFHLYPKEKYTSFEQFGKPEILRSSLTKIVLDAKVYSNNMNSVEFMSHLPCPPAETSITRAVNELKDLELLDENENLTPLGKILVDFQLEPKLAKVLVNSVIYKCVTPIVDIVTLFAADTELFSTALIAKEKVKRIKSQFSSNSDHLALMRIFEKWLQLYEEESPRSAEKFCYDANLIPHKLQTIEKLRNIHFDYLHNGLYETLGIADDYSDNDELVKGVLFSGTGTLLQSRTWDKIKGRLKKANVFITNKNHKATITSDSVNCKNKDASSCFFIYINETRSNIRRTTLIRECSVISPMAILLLCNKTLTVNEQPNDLYLLSSKDIKIDLLCPKNEATVLLNCKEALTAAYDYYIYQMTVGKEFDERANKSWNEMLNNLSQILTRHSTSE